MKNYVCEKCGSMDLFIKKNGEHQTGLYCSDCGKWIKWVSKSELPLVEKFIEEQKINLSNTISSMAGYSQEEFNKKKENVEKLNNKDDKMNKWDKLKTYIESGIFFEKDNEPLKKVYDYMLQLEEESC